MTDKPSQVSRRASSICYRRTESGLQMFPSPILDSLAGKARALVVFFCKVELELS